MSELVIDQAYIKLLERSLSRKQKRIDEMEYRLELDAEIGAKMIAKQHNQIKELERQNKIMRDALEFGIDNMFKAEIDEYRSMLAATLIKALKECEER